jgi:A/G-specific adenine glycosylase
MNSENITQGLLVKKFRRLYSKEGVSKKTITLFRQAIYNFYRKHARNDLPWRQTDDPFHILISEIMLQQTQVERVIYKYSQFLAEFPDIRSLSRAPLRKIFTVWQGLGYNRRALALKNLSQKIVKECPGAQLPLSVDALMMLPGVGRATASAVAAFAYQQPVVFIETNIRSVYLYFFFQNTENIKDQDILPFVERTMDKSHPREWYYALMDYGAFLKKQGINPNRRSAHYLKQSPFHGSNRQFRGMILRTLLQNRRVSEGQLIHALKVSPVRAQSTLKQLRDEGFLKKHGDLYKLS